MLPLMDMYDGWFVILHNAFWIIPGPGNSIALVGELNPIVGIGDDLWENITSEITNFSFLTYKVGVGYIVC